MPCSTSGFTLKQMAHTLARRCQTYIMIRGGSVVRKWTNCSRKLPHATTWSMTYRVFGLHRLWKRRLVALCRVKRGENALDICCGTGDVSFLLAGQEPRVTGLDFNLKMLSVAQQRKAKRVSTGRERQREIRQTQTWNSFAEMP